MGLFQPRRRQILSLFGLGFATALGSSFLPKSRNQAVSALDPRSNPSLLAQGDDVNLNQPLHDFQGISQWLNSEPLRVADLKGKVVLVQFWAFGCINSQRTLPYITRWHQDYADQGLQVIGVHTPEFGYERDGNNVSLALKEHQIKYPVPLDNNYQTWKAYRNHYWPHLFLASREGIIAYHHIGEGAYSETEQTIQTLLA
ncbi:MAG: redoxin domain-containing protein [Acaryochloridaceae cyanobacterium SU_2_1]|nr:redoxin domain-containing protein [Acaryochloridaceae cyanobacterium SU_2_1]